MNNNMNPNMMGGGQPQQPMPQSVSVPPVAPGQPMMQQTQLPPLPTFPPEIMDNMGAKIDYLTQQGQMMGLTEPQIEEWKRQLVEGQVAELKAQDAAMFNEDAMVSSDFSFGVDMTLYPKDTSFTVTLSLACSNLQRDLANLWGSPNAVMFGEKLTELANMEKEYEGILNSIAYAILNNASPYLKNPMEIKAKLDRDVAFHSGFPMAPYHLGPEVVEKKLLFIKNKYTGMNKEKAGLAMGIFNGKMQECLSNIEKKANDRISSYKGLEGEYEGYKNQILDFKTKFSNKVEELNTFFSQALNMEIDNPMIGSKYKVDNDFTSVTTTFKN